MESEVEMYYDSVTGRYISSAVSEFSDNVLRGFLGRSLLNSSLLRGVYTLTAIEVHMELPRHTFFVTKSVPNCQLHSVIFSKKNIKLKVLKVLNLGNLNVFMFQIASLLQ